VQPPPPGADSGPQPLEVVQDQLLGRDLAQLSRRVRKRRLVLYFGRSTFADNTKYLFLRDAARERDHEVLWCTFEPSVIAQLREAGLPCLDLGADLDATIDVLLHAAVAVFCVNPSESLRGAWSLNGCLAGAVKLQLWHGVSVKHLLLRLVPHLGVRELVLRRAFTMATQADLVLSTAGIFDDYWRSCFGTRRLVRAGMPRNEVLLREATPAERIGCEPGAELQAALDGPTRAILVVPTWQRGEQTYMADQRFAKSLLAIAARGRVTVVFKTHPLYHVPQASTAKRTAGFHVLDPGVDVYPLLDRFDALVTDYSSIMFDFLLTGKPVVSLDLGEAGHRTFEPDWSLVPDVPFRHLFRGPDFEGVLRTALDDDHLGPNRREMVQRIFETDPLQAGEQLLGLVDRLVDEALAESLTVELG
jgi:CDP-glycerol glycerophosphotransferase